MTRLILSLPLFTDKCLKWRTLPFSTGNIGKNFGDEWVCAENSDTQHNKLVRIIKAFLKPEDQWSCKRSPEILA